MSAMEDAVRTALDNENIDFIAEYSFPGLRAENGKKLRFDFCVLDDDGNIDFLIECQGKQHYSPVDFFGGARALSRQRHNDAMKRKYCRRNGYLLVEIPYKDEKYISYDYIMKAAGY